MIKTFFSKQFLKYVLIGILGTGLDFLILYILVEYLHVFYLLAAFISVAIVIWISFTLNKYWTFQNYENKYFVQFFKYLIAHSIGVGLNLGILALLVEMFDMWYILAKVFATAVAVLWNFLAAKKWIFSKEEHVLYKRGTKWRKS